MYLTFIPPVLAVSARNLLYVVRDISTFCVSVLSLLLKSNTDLNDQTSYYQTVCLILHFTETGASTGGVSSLRAEGLIVAVFASFLALLV